MAETARQCIIAFDEKKEGNHSLPSYHQQPTAKEIHYVLPVGLGQKNYALPSSSLKMPQRRKSVDELLLGLLCEKQDLCVPDFEVRDEEEALGECADTCSYIELIDLNGKYPLL
jgi:hypothetical protein